MRSKRSKAWRQRKLVRVMERKLSGDIALEELRLAINRMKDNAIVAHTKYIYKHCIGDQDKE